MSESISWRSTWRNWIYTLLHAPRGTVGRPESAAVWDADYHAGRWSKLDSPAQLAHYAVIAGYVAHFFPDRPRILDVGCGHGRLFDLLKLRPFGAYLGFDLSEEAVRRAAVDAPENARFEAGDMEQWTSPEQFDVVLISDSLQYTRRPLEVLDRYRSLLSPGGRRIVCLAQGSLNWGIERELRRRFPVERSTLVRNEEGEAWDVKVLDGPAAATGGQ
jgi:SAM-dependent methyltransferase